ncbi:ROK family protein [Paenibacillus sp. 1011MAR3C5]|uniref:ROK family protein n=1 Tax=Paenibacillus sp. 1011MAR3C5 TaxID=1675787 RepID=UPI000E6D54B5|nr:ROK family protein [Paenibacillus sp. 1011MAR3C5]RJE87457.1 ROK family protein [Paenibacillus sp. 1011MAR3C5]
MKRAQNIDEVKRANRGLVLNLLLRHRLISRSMLAAKSGLNKATITNIVNEFVEMGVVKEQGPILSDNGRKITGITLTLDDVATMAVRINRDAIEFALCDIHAAVLHKSMVGIDKTTPVASILAIIYEGIDQMLAMDEGKKVLGIGIAIVGPLMTFNHTTIAKVYDMPELSKVDFQEHIQAKYPQLSVFIDHDANVSALREWRDYVEETGLTKGIMMYLNLGDGIGGGIIIDGNLIRGKNGIAGEIGHMGINFNAKRNEFNKVGILERYAAPINLIRSVEERLHEFPHSQLHERSTISDIYHYYEKDDELAVWAVNQMAWFLSYGIKNLLYILNPDTIVFGDMIVSSPKLLAQLKLNLSYDLPEEIVDSIDIRFSSYEKGGMLEGAGLMVVKKYMDSLDIIDFIETHYG